VFQRFKYGGLALQFWGLGDRPTTCHLKIANCKENRFVASEQSEWNRPRKWERNDEMRTAIRNVHILYRAGAVNELVEEVD
jgi:hypothetical protein